MTARPLSAWFSGLGGLGSVQGDGNELDAHLQFRRRRGRHRLSLRPALPGRPRRRLHPRHAVGEPLHGPGLDRLGQRRGLRQLHPGGLLRRRAGGLRLLQQPDAAADPDPRPAAAHGHGQHGRQPVPGAGRDRLQARRLGAGGATSRRSRASRSSSTTQNAFTESGANSLNLNVAQQTTNSVRTVLGAEFASSIAARQPSARSTSACGWAGSTSTPTPAGRSRRRSPVRRRHRSPSTAPRRRATRRSSASRPTTSIADGHAALPALRRRARLGHRQPRAHGRLAHELVKPVSGDVRARAGRRRSRAGSNNAPPARASAARASPGGTSDAPA